MGVTERLYRKTDQTVASLALLPETDGQTLIQCDWDTFKKVSGMQVWAQLVATGSISLLVLSSVLFAPVWGLRKLLGKLRDAGPLPVRVMPLLGAVFLVMFDLLLAFGVRGMITGNHIDDVAPLGVPSVISVGIMLSSIAFAWAAAASVYVIYRERTAAMNRVVYWHSASVTLALAAVAVYYAYWGLIGLRFWA